MDKSKNQINSNLSGVSGPSGVIFCRANSQVSVSTKNLQKPPKYTIYPNQVNLHKIVKSIPFIRGPIRLLDGIINIFRKLYAKNKFTFFFLCFAILFDIFAPQSFAILSETWFDYIFDYLIYAGLIILLALTVKNHGAEHKLISAFEHNQDLSLENIKRQPKENRRCGTVLVTWIFIFFFSLFHYIPSQNLLWLICFSVAYEISLLIRHKTLLGTILYLPGWLAQKITTMEPDDKRLLRVREGMIVLLDNCNVSYKMEGKKNGL